ncbi:RNA 3'-terminal phosphate cyclase [Aliikangiella maris]|uniref:RNA 3'-terminal phosphate cyclase n=2 Tax=Aliikangiella maris TaxID=3162458 RepID=A0ABV3MU98_9GAMM
MTSRPILNINGALGEGGGQILRTSLTLAACLQQPISINNIRAGRKKPGLRLQHRACIDAAQQVCNAKVSGNEINSTQIEFIPGPIESGQYQFYTDTAASTTLIFQTVMPVLSLANRLSRIELGGGTHNPLAPSYEFLTKSFLQVIRKMGICIDHQISAFGFFPAGKGVWQATISPRTTGIALNLNQQGKIISQKATVYHSLIPTHVAARELAQIKKRLGWTGAQLAHHPARSVGSGNLISLAINFENLSVVFDAIGQKGISAEKVADNVIKQYLNYVKSTAVVDEYLADQLMLPMALFNGGRFITASLSQHAITNACIINQFIPETITITPLGMGLHQIIVNGLNLQPG